MTDASIRPAMPAAVRTKLLLEGAIVPTLLRIAAPNLVVNVVLMVPWLIVNKREFGFYGISVGRGMGLFTRAIEIDRLPLPEVTRYPQAKEAAETGAVLRWSAAQSPSLPADVRGRFLAKYASRLTVDGELIVTSQRFRDQARNVDDAFDTTRADLLGKFQRAVHRPGAVLTLNLEVLDAARFRMTQQESFRAQR